MVLCLEAVSQLPQKYVLVIVGNGPEMNKLKRCACQLNVCNRVFFIGSSPNPITYYNIADVFLMTSAYESFGQTIIEAMACGLPVIGFKNNEQTETATEEIIEDEINGLLCDNNSNSLTKAILVISEMTSNCKLIIKKNNINKVKNNYSWPMMCQKLLKLVKVEKE